MEAFLLDPLLDAEADLELQQGSFLNMNPIESSGGRVLIIEDDVSMATLLSESLRHDSHTVEVARTGATALTLVASWQPDVILSDLNLPDADGIAILREIRQIPQASMIPVIILSARTDREARLEGLSWAEDFLAKPADPLELRARVRSMLRLKRVQTDLAQMNRTLEERVIKRTEEIVQINRTLSGTATRLAASESEIRYLSQALSEIQEAERARFAREIHDALGTSLITLKLMIQTQCGLLGQKDPVQDDAVKQMIELVDETTETARGIAHSLSPVALAGLGLKEATAELLDRLAAAHPSVQFELKMKGRLPRLSDASKREAYRLIQEAIANSLKHSKANRIGVELGSLNGGLRILIRDNGSGLKPNSKKGIGLRLMAERAQAIGCLLTLKNGRSKGLEVVVERKRT